ncbi:2-amino-4-hydroxy-6-hydroxymethyldihydropteridine diphosphokinase [Bacillus suaedaesalsae]|uniref:2-amino-4-hydroxy-6-hydroxymethyldihydropteridine diphosphokinase n=1 Tax=Bacillus suaedaesalsae TaxID=2810349 RepID=A0ABS2DC75_9BACI|nr:2-amino-4-hydroxy-6-hydroxymethyldihydropteridine diphosphokinase [Bacillus suaedaesalsae]MBM6616077.1 2-amino-4-hydroxy-6-hydroxymethyldihydropteridine diphosphokinase [Bacillus suaedaesalsae]
MNNRAFIGLGSNIQDRLGFLRIAIQTLSEHPEIQVVNYSSIYDTDPVGYTDQDSFLNMVVEINTNLPPDELLKTILEVERQLGRKRELKWGPRTLDLDILMYNQENIEDEELIVPHPRMSERAFVMIPLMEIDPELSIKGVMIGHIVNELKDREGVQIWKQKSGEDVFELFAN